MTAYADLIGTYTQRDPRWVEAYMRIEHPTLDHLSQDQFAAAVRYAAACIDVVGEDKAKQLARTFGL